MRHLISIDDLTEDEIKELVDLALGLPENFFPKPGEPVALIFLEPSSRTRVSFELAALQLEAKPILIQENGSSLEKNETLTDTLLIFRSMGVRVFVVRCKSENQLTELKKISGISVISGGEGRREHPTQALLDLVTLRSLVAWDSLSGKTLAIVGDLKNSRVARSWFLLAPKVGVKLKLVSPAEWKPVWCATGEHFTDLKTGLKGADFVMALRVQRERHDADSGQDSLNQLIEAYVRDFQIQAHHLQPNAFLLHPGPVNWGVELADNLKTHPQSLILLQVKFGVALRKAVLSKVFDALPRNSSDN